MNDKTKEFVKKCMSHDWYYYYSDDPSVYAAGAQYKKGIDIMFKSMTDEEKEYLKKVALTHEQWYF